MSNKTKEDYIQRTFSLCSKDFTNHIRAGSKRVSSASPINNKMFCLPGENEVLERLANLFVSGDFGRVSCERGATCNIAQPSKSLEEK